MKNQPNQRTAYENLLHRNRVTYRAAGREIGCSGEYVRQLATGLKPATGEVGTRFLAYIAQLQSPNRQPGIAGETAPAARPRTAGAHSPQREAAI